MVPNGAGERSGAFRNLPEKRSPRLRWERRRLTRRGVPLSAISGRSARICHWPGEDASPFRPFPARLGLFRPGWRLEQSESGFVWTSGGERLVRVGDGIPLAEAADQAGHHLPEERPPHLHLHLLGEEGSREQWGAEEGSLPSPPAPDGGPGQGLLAFLSFPPSKSCLLQREGRRLQREGGTTCPIM